MLILATGITLQPWLAKDGFMGPDVCRDCHAIEYETWLATQHGVSLDGMPKLPLAKRVVEAVDGATTEPRRSAAQITRSRRRAPQGWT